MAVRHLPGLAGLRGGPASQGATSKGCECGFYPVHSLPDNTEAELRS